MMTISKPEQILQPEPVIAPKAGSIAEALQAKGEKIARSLSLIKNASGNYEFNGKEYSVAGLAMEL